ncbi:hypothetical protein CTEN210_11972 [Chaetoceros tenuissimus]|uniref:SET domain-containing protein n=1 Tax=Chaetoceros tenuissimus TaxID=426638 RepID=A0AAD3D0C2_9STRA|nr:hypothetical protein CTEN210_11972 [Chaetoceros tenuissimus]
MKLSQECSSCICSGCNVVSICNQCNEKDVSVWHRQSGECFALQCLSVCNAALFAGDQELNEVEKAQMIDSSILLAIRTIFRKWFESNFRKDSAALVSSPFPELNWSLYDNLYTTDISGTTEERDHYDIAMNGLCNLIKETLTSHKKDTSWITKELFDDAMGKIIGCGHSVTDLNQSLGCQSIGRTLFFEHSFYNHSCAPNAFLSCNLQSQDEANPKEHICAVEARLHCIKDIEQNDNVCISYIPTSGLDQAERQTKLQQNYGFQCMCEACETKSSRMKDIEALVQVPTDADITTVREMQFQIHQNILELKQKSRESFDMDNFQDEVNSCLMMIAMNKRGIANQNIPQCHEISMENKRLYASALSLIDENEKAIEEYVAFLESVEKVNDIFDPVAVATTRVEYAQTLKKLGNQKEKDELEQAHDELILALGKDHSFTKRIFEMLSNESSQKIGQKRKAMDEIPAP